MCVKLVALAYVLSAGTIIYILSFSINSSFKGQSFYLKKDPNHLGDLPE